MSGSNTGLPTRSQEFVSHVKPVQEKSNLRANHIIPYGCLPEDFSVAQLSRQQERSVAVLV